MTSSQQERLGRERSHTGNALFGFLAFILICGFCLVITNANESPNARSRPHKPNNTEAAIIFVTLAGGISMVVLFKWMSLGDDIHNKRVMWIKGPIQRRYHSRRSASYYAIICGTKTFEVSKPIYDAFTDNKPYILYYTAIAGTLIAAEHVLSQS